MKARCLLTSIATVITLAAAPVLAADMPVPVQAPAPARVAVAPAYYWSGCYLGAHGGYGWGDKKFEFTNGETNTLDVNGAVAGGQFGCDLQFASNFVVGVAGAGSWTNVKETKSVAGTELSTDVAWLATFTARLGYSWGPGLIYAVGGAAWAGDRFGVTSPQTIARSDEVKLGWLVGGGLEYMFIPNWTLFVEYNFMDFGQVKPDWTISPPASFAGANIDQQIHVVKAGINFRFGNFGGPVVGRY
jgi:outer membrane immunogenic protein